MGLRSRMGSGVSTVGRMLVTLIVVCIAAVALVAVAPATSTRALTGSDFNPGLIISDDLFYNGSAMTSAEIQTFLNGKIGTCQNSNCLNIAKVPLSNRAATFGTRTGNLLCAAITGGTISVAELIYRTQVACGISAKVILVTLQKEQGLVTSRAPSSSALMKAMGMACPDTAPCNSAYAGLATQIITGTEQLKDYKANVFGRQPGVNYIRFNPNSGCGGSNVNILDFGTAALYNYTPYQPNAAALANLGGVGNGCSSYGNRNFWVFYNTWFGSPTVPPCTTNPTRDITDYWNNLGGATSPLGALVSPGIVTGPTGTAIGYYANGALYCTPKVGPVPVLGDLRVKYDALGGPGSALGAPLTPESSFTANGITGVLQTFRNGSMQSSATTGAYAVLAGPIRNAWGVLGGSRGTLGWPTGDQETVAGGIRQKFQNGLIVVPNGRSAIVMTGAIEDYWMSGSHAASLGSPTAPAAPLTAGGVTGTLEYFDRGIVLSSTTTGTFAVLTGPMRNAWGASGGSAGPMGWPTGDQQQAADGGVSQTFQGGTLFASSSGASGSLSGAIATYWATGSNAALLGYPTKNAVAWTAGGVTGTLQYFERGLVLSSTATGTHAVITGPVYKAWAAKGGSGGSLGWPTGELVIGSTLTQTFQGGTVSVASGVTGAIATYWATGGNASLLGSPTGAATPYSAGGISGQLQYFAKGLVMSSTTTGTFSVLTGPIATGWGKLGGSGGSLGWPTGDQGAVSGRIQQTFQHGTAIVTGTSAVVLSGAIAVYWASDDHAVALGLPTTSSSPFSAGGVTGTLQYFANGLVLSSSSGTFAVLGAIRNAWGALGGSGGSLGWPVADRIDTAGGAQQAFQHGTVFAPTNGAPVVLSGAIASYWQSDPHSSLLGSPTASAASYAAGGVSGILQNFERGVVMSSSTTGTFSVLLGAVRTQWLALGGSGGSLGWPTADQTTVSGNVTQRFQHGTITILPDGSSVLVSGDYFTYWSTGTNATTVGPPTAAPIAWTAGGVTGSYQVYENAMIMSSKATGTYAVLNGPIRTAWGGTGGSGGSLGWPIGDQTVVPAGVQQEFQHGTVTVPTSGSPYVTYN